MNEQLLEEIIARFRELKHTFSDRQFGRILDEIQEIQQTISGEGRSQIGEFSGRIETILEAAGEGRDHCQLSQKTLSEVRKKVRDLFEEYRKFQTLYDIGKIVTSEHDIDSLLRLSMDKVIEVTLAERGMIILVDETKQTTFEVARNINKSEIKSPEFEVSRHIIDEVLCNGESLFVANALDHPRFREAESVKKLKLLSVLCVPIKLNENVLGLIYIDNRKMSDLFKESTIDLVGRFADQIAIAANNALTQKALQQRTEQLDQELRARYHFESIIGTHPRMTEVLSLVSKVADTDATVFIYGESGTGKELVARALHFNSSRRDHPFVAINCGALPENLLESELFGHAKGAFTGAVTDKQGKFEAAQGGTLFLDEIGDMSLPLQIKLLRVFQDGEFTPLGCVDVRHCDVRIIAATNQDPKKLVDEGRLREDLYFRLNTIPIVIPPLRERREDIPLLINHFLESFQSPGKKESLKLSREARSALSNYPYPGNVRELENIIKRIVILAGSETIERADLPRELQDATTPEDVSLPFKEAKNRIVETFEKNYLIRKLQENGGNISHAARASGMHLKNFYEKISRYGINVEKYKTG